MISKPCSRCKIVKPAEEFNKNSTKKDKVCSFCKTCSASYSQEHYQKNKAYYAVKARAADDLARQEFLVFKQTLSCTRCPEASICCLDFHHLDSNTKEINISSAVAAGWRMKRLKKELDKCIVLCSNCHRKLHAGEWSNG